MKEFYNVREIAAIYGLKESSIRTWVRDKTVPYYKIGGAIRFKREDIEKKIESKEE